MLSGIFDMYGYIYFTVQKMAIILYYTSILGSTWSGKCTEIRRKAHAILLRTIVSVSQPGSYAQQAVRRSCRDISNCDILRDVHVLKPFQYEILML
jgi:hypothetical protein